MNWTKRFIATKFQGLSFWMWHAQSYDLMNEGPRGSLESLLCFQYLYTLSLIFLTRQQENITPKICNQKESQLFCWRDIVIKKVFKILVCFMIKSIGKFCYKNCHIMHTSRSFCNFIKIFSNCWHHFAHASKYFLKHPQ